MYHLLGIISTYLFALTLLGLSDQLFTIWQRKQNYRVGGEKATDVISANKFLAIFFAYFSFLLYGMSHKPFNHYLVWPRIAACALVILILFEVKKEQLSFESKRAFFLACASFTGSLIFLASGVPISEQLNLLSQILTVVVSIALMIGYLSQVREILTYRSLGGVSLRMHKLILIKDVSSLLFGCSMGLVAGWPVILISAVGILNKLTLLITVSLISRRIV